MEYLLALGVFLLFAFWVNHGIKMTGLYGDDLYLWYCFDTESLREFILPLGGTKFRLIHNILCYLQLLFMGPDIWLMVPFNIVVNALIALTLFHIVRKIAGCPFLAGACGLAYLLSHLSYYQITQGYGLMEASALWLALIILYLMYRYLNGLGDGRKLYMAASGLYFIVSLIHERYMVLLVVLAAAVVFKHALTGKKEYRLLIWAFLSFAAVMALRLLTTGTIIPAGTGGTEVTDTFSLQEALGYAVDNVLYVFGINAGPIHLDGVEWQNVPRRLRAVVYLTDAILGVLVLLAAFSIWKQKKRRKEYLCTILLILLFMAMCIGAASVTVRLEMRWVYVTYGAALILLAYLWKIVKNGGGKLAGRAAFAAAACYFVLILPVELFYRDNYENLYFWKGQEEANSLADVTWGVYGDDIFGSEIYIIGEEWEDAEYRTDAFWRPYRRDPSQPLPTVKFIDSLGEAWPITDRDKKIVLKEDPEHHRYVDVTSMIKIKKYQNVYGYYEYDGWMDQKTKIRVFTGTSGQLRIGFYAPKEITGNETITVSSGDRLIQEIHLKDHWADLVIPVMKQRYIELDIECNFYSVDPNQEMRGETPMAVNVQMSAE